MLAGTMGRNGKILAHNRLKPGAIAKNRMLAARPFLSTALAMREASLGNRIGAAAAQGIKMQRVRQTGKAR
jgi:hypothetical protein